MLRSLKSATPLLTPLLSTMLGFHLTRAGLGQLGSPMTVTEIPQCVRALRGVLGASVRRKCCFTWPGEFRTCQTTWCVREGTQFPLQDPLLEEGPGGLPLQDFLRTSPRSHLHPTTDEHAGAKPGPLTPAGDSGLQDSPEHPRWALPLFSASPGTLLHANPPLGGTTYACSPPFPSKEN